MGCVQSEGRTAKFFSVRELDIDTFSDWSTTDEKSMVKRLSNFWTDFQLKKQLGVGLQDEQLCVVENRKTRALFLARVISKEEHCMKEFSIVRKFAHPLVARCKQAFKDESKYFILYEYCSGVGLLERIRKDTYYSERVASQTMKMMLKAVWYLHNLDIVHRGIRPRAFMYATENGPGLKLVEFGFAMQVFPNKQYQSRKGSPYLMPPEEVRNTQPRSSAILKKADIWALGVCLYVMLTGNFPFAGTTRDDVFRKVCHRKLSFPGVSKEGQDLLKRLLEKNPKVRLTIEEAMNHPWIKRGGQNSHQIMKSAITALRSFNARDNFQQAMHQVSLSNHNVGEEYFKELFSCFDRDGNGFLTLDECVEAVNLHLVGSGRAKKIAEEIMSQAICDKLTFQDFKNAMEAYQLKNDFLIQAIFFALDLNTDGYISLPELLYALPKASSEMIRTNFESFSKADENNDNHLSFDEFKVLFTEEISRREFVNDIMQFVNNGMIAVNDDDPFGSLHSLKGNLSGSMGSPSTSVTSPSM